MITRRWFLGWCFVGMLTACGLASLGPTPNADVPRAADSIILAVSAAASLGPALQELGPQWEQETGHRVSLNLGSSGQLAQQIERGAPVDIFLAANQALIDDLDRAGLIASDTKAVYGMGRLTLWRRQDSPVVATELADLLKPEVKRVAIANPDHAPYGMAAREALQAAGLWEMLQPKLVLGNNVEDARRYAETGNVEVALIALALSVGQPGQWTLVPEELHRPLAQLLAVPKHAPHPQEARHFAAFLNGPKGRPIMQKYGFVLPEEPLP